MRGLGSLFAMVGILAAATPAGADDSTATTYDIKAGGSGEVEAGAYLGGFISNFYHQFYDDDIMDRPELSTVSPELGLRLAYLPHKYVGVEGEGGVVIATTEGTDESVRIFALRAQVIGQYPIDKFVPFAVAGLGLAATNSGDEAVGNDTDFPLHIGAGARYFATKSIALRADVRLLRGPSSKDPHTLDASYGEFLFGVSFLPSFEAAQPPPNLDPDNDGVIGDADACPNEAGFTADGCPVRDKDADGMLDDVDKCPNEPENVNSWEDEDGCPDTIPDTDGDGMNDLADKCREQAEDEDGFEDEDGCPEVDNDKDGLLDDADKCPNEAGPPANEGCPDKDSDGDGVVDRLDNCPEEAGTADNHGCVAKQLVTITQDQLKILDKVYFRTNRASLRSRSRPLLDNVAKVLQSHPKLRVRVEGHTDAVGSDEANKILSQKRAEAVVDYLVKKGVSRDRLEPVGFGEEKPIDDNGTRKGREANRRVEFNLIQE